MKIDLKTKSYLANVIAHGLKTEITEELLDAYCYSLVMIINDQPFDAWAEGDRDGILISTNDNLIMAILSKPELVEFRIIGEFDNPDPKFAELITRVVLTVIGCTLQFLPGLGVSPNGGLSVGDKKEEAFTFKDDGFGIS